MLFKQSVKEFNSRCAKYKHTMCNICRITRMDFCGSTKYNYPVCNDCQTRFTEWNDVSFFHAINSNQRDFMTKMEEFRIYFAKNLPVWYRPDDTDKQDPQYHMPEELSGLTIGEKMIIQRLSTYVPVVRYNKGQLGCKGLNFLDCHSMST